MYALVNKKEQYLCSVSWVMKPVLRFSEKGGMFYVSEEDVLQVQSNLKQRAGIELRIVKL